MTVYIIGGSGSGKSEFAEKIAVSLNGKRHVYIASMIPRELCIRDSYNSAGMTLEEIINVMKESEECGLNTVRLQTGDPSVYGAIHEQMRELDKLNIKYELCPGVSSMFGAASALKAEFTPPEVSQSVIITRAAGLSLIHI